MNNRQSNRSDLYYFIKSRSQTPVNTLFIAANLIVFLLVELKGTSLNSLHMISCGASYTPLVAAGEYYRLFTCMFLHFGIEHLLNNMLVLLFIGDMLERHLGSIKYFSLYLLGGLGASWISFQAEVWNQQAMVSAGASGAVFAVMGALLYVVAINRGRLEDMTAKKLLFMAALSLYYGFTSTGVDNVAHVGGFVIGIILGIVLYRKK